MAGKRFALLGLVLVLVGSALMGGCGGGGGGGGGPAVQVGVDWTRVADGGGALFSSPGEDVYVTDVCAGGPGLVAVGYRVAAGSSSKGGAFPCALEIWTSEDGSAWSRLGAEAFPDGASPLMDKEYSREGWSEPCVVSSPAGLLVTCGLHIFMSGDGLGWNEVKGVAAFEGSPCEMNSATGRFVYTYAADDFVDVASYGGGYVASVVAGSTRPGAQGWLPGPSIWTSPDGKDWSLVQLEYVEVFGMDDVNAVAPGGPGLVAVGYGSGYLRAWTGAPDALTWTRSPDSPGLFLIKGGDAFRSLAPGGPGLVAVSINRFWASLDGVDWSSGTSDETELAGAELNAVCAGPLAAVGIVRVEETVPDKPLIRYTNAGAWTSPDGLTWTRVLLPRADEESKSSEVANGVASFERGLVVVGSEEAGGQPARGVIWTSLSR